MIWPYWRKPRSEEDREDVVSDEDGTITFNYLQQRPVDNSERPATPLEEAGTTDPWGITS